ncbi:hypothetical protein ACFLRC_01980, partial [Candidatus Altiarchaeota archaeon]
IVGSTITLTIRNKENLKPVRQANMLVYEGDSELNPRVGKLQTDEAGRVYFQLNSTQDYLVRIIRGGYLSRKFLITPIEEVGDIKILIQERPAILSTRRVSTTQKKSGTSLPPQLGINENFNFEVITGNVVKEIEPEITIPPENEEPSEKNTSGFLIKIIFLSGAFLFLWFLSRRSVAREENTAFIN